MIWLYWGQCHENASRIGNKLQSCFYEKLFFHKKLWHVFILFEYLIFEYLIQLLPERMSTFIKVYWNATDFTWMNLSRTAQYVTLSLTQTNMNTCIHTTHWLSVCTAQLTNRVSTTLQSNHRGLWSVRCLIHDYNDEDSSFGQVMSPHWGNMTWPKKNYLPAHIPTYLPTNLSTSTREHP